MSKKYTDALDNLLDRPIAFNPSFKKITGSTNAALLLSQAFYWTKRTSDPDGWFYKTRDEWMEETALTEAELDGARDKCRTTGVMDEKLKGVPATIHYRVNKPKVYELLGVQFPENPESGFPGNSQIPEKQESGNYGDFNKESESSSETTSGGGLSEKEIEQANAKVDAIIANQKKVKYTHREKFPEPYLPFADLYFELTKQQPSKRDLGEWMLTFEDWKANELQPEHIRAAWQYANRSDGGFLVGRPAALTKTAVALKSKMIANKTTAPQVDEVAVEQTKQLVEEKFNATFVPRPANVQKPRIGA